MSGVLGLIGRKALVLGGLSLVLVALTAVLRVLDVDPVWVFAAAAAALAVLAALVGEGTDQLGGHVGPAAAGVLQSGLANLPELFINIFALQAGLVAVVQTALIGSILANSLLILGLAFFFGGLRHGMQRFSTETPRMIGVLILLATAAVAIPAIATAPGEPDAGHGMELSVVTAVVLLIVFAGSIPFSIRSRVEQGRGADEPRWPVWLVAAVLLASAVGAGVTSDWFVEALRPSMASLGLSEEFVGLIVVAIAGNAVENVVGIQMALQNRAELAVSLILNSSLQVALALIPVLVLLSLFIGPGSMSLVVDPLLVGALVVTALLSALITVDGRSTWLEGLALVGLYVIIATSVWFGAPIGT